MNRSSAPHRPTAVTRETAVARDRRPDARAPTASTAVRTAVASDRTFVLALQRRFANQLGFLPTQAIDELLDGGRVTLALENGDPAGYVASRTHLRCQRSTAPIVQAAVCLDAQRRSLGTTLIDAVCQDAWVAGTAVVQCWCREDLDACDFWAACGFTAVATRDPQSARGKLLVCFRRLLPGHRDELLGIVPKNAGWKAATIRQDRPSQLLMPWGIDGTHRGLPDVRGK